MKARQLILLGGVGIAPPPSFRHWGPIRGFGYSPVCEFQYELYNEVGNKVRNI